MDSQAPLVTAVLVCWNHQRFVRQAVLSALQQTYTNLEIIVFDNGSTDSSFLELKDLAKEFEFTFIAQENKGLVRTLNQGLERAKGEYFTMLSTDDVWLPNKIQAQVEYLENNPDVQMLFGGIIGINESNKIIEIDAKTFAGEVSLDALMCTKLSINGPTVMCRTSTLRSVGGYDESLRIEDFPLAVEFTLRGHRVFGLDMPLTMYRRHENNWTSAVNSTGIWDDVFAIGKKYKHLPQYKQFIKCHLEGYFRLLAGRNRLAAIRFIATEPVAWKWNDVGVGILKLITPNFINTFVRRIF